jgi:tetratricopeptide (TPR) repeat protein
LSRTAFISTCFVLAFLVPYRANTAFSQPVNLDDYIKGPINPDRAKAYFHYALSKLYEKEGNRSRSEEELRSALAFDPKSSILRSETAEIRLRSGKVEEASALCREAISLDKDNSDAHFLLANIYLFQSEQPKPTVSHQDAINEFKEVIRIKPDHDSAYLKIGQIYLRQNEAEKAVEYLEKGIETAGASDDYYFFLAQAYQQTGKSKEALNSALRAVQINPAASNTELLEKLLSESGRTKDAVDMYKQVLQMDAENLEIKKRLGAALLSNNQFDEATKILEEVHAAEPEDLPTMIQMARSFLGTQQYQKSIEILQTALKLDPSNTGTQYYLAYTYAEMGETEQAMSGFRKLLSSTYKANSKYSPHEFEQRLLFQRHLAFLYQENGENEKAVEEFRALLSAQDSPENFRALANALRVIQKKEEALSLLEKGSQKYPQDKYLILFKAQLLGETGEFQKGEALLRTAIEKTPDDSELYVTLSQVHIESKQFRKAEELVLTALKKFNQDPILQFQLGVVYERSKKFAKAEEVFLQIIKGNPRHASALNYLGFMWADQGIRLNESLDYIQKAVNLDPNNGAYLDSLGWVHFRMNNLTEAEKFLLTAAHRVKNDPTIHDHLGDLYFRLGRFTKAEESWRQALACSTQSEETQKVQKKLKQLRNQGSSKP